MEKNDDSDAGNEVVISDYVRVERMPGFECTLCGDCCRNRVIPLFKEDVRRLEEAGYRDFYELTTKLERHFIGAPYKMKLKTDGSCIFLREDNLCLAYEYRPDTCRRYPFIVGDGVILVSLSCPGVKWDEEGDSEPYRLPSKKIFEALMEAGLL